MPPRASKYDPYRTFKFRVRLGEATVAGVTKVSALGRTVTPTELKEGGDMLAPRQNPGAVSYDEVVLEWGLSLDRTFEEWANAVTRLQADPADPAVKGFKRTVYIDVYDLDGNPADRSSKPVFTYKLHRCWVSKYTALPALDAASSGIGIQSVTLRHEGWERVV
ncbi:MAG TPA: phage tail protein [Longimicrobiales bacterium]